MAEIRHFPFVRHLRSDAVSHILLYRNARLRREGNGVALWFNPMSDSISEVPTDNQDLQLVIHARSADFQDITAQGVLTYRATDPEKLAQRIDFSIDLNRGQWTNDPIEQHLCAVRIYRKGDVELPHRRR